MYEKYKEIFADREDAAQRLKDVLPMQKVKEESWKFIAVSKGGLVLASHVLGKLPNRLDFLFSEPIYAPNHNECEVARVSESEEIVIHENLVASFDIKYDYIYGEARRKHEEKILSYIYQYRKGRHFSSIRNKVVVLIDEGSETGSKFLTGLKTILAQQPKAIYVVAPILPTDVLETLETFCDEVFFLYDIDDYVETSLYYKNFEKVSEDQVEKLLESKKTEKKTDEV